MKFREYDNLQTIILVGDNSTDLANQINLFGLEYDIIDLQYSSHYHNILEKERYSALILYKN